jgi:hypothetical protein
MALAILADVRLFSARDGISRAEIGKSLFPDNFPIPGLEILAFACVVSSPKEPAQVAKLYGFSV